MIACIKERWPPNSSGESATLQKVIDNRALFGPDELAFGVRRAVESLSGFCRGILLLFSSGLTGQACFGQPVCDELSVDRQTPGYN